MISPKIPIAVSIALYFMPICGIIYKQITKLPYATQERKLIMKTKLVHLLFTVVFTATIFFATAYINENKAVVAEPYNNITQWNENPEETNDVCLYNYKVFLSEGLLTEEQVCYDIIYGNNLTEQGLKDLISAGYLHAYIDVLISAGRLPEGFTPSAAPAPKPEPIPEQPSEETPSQQEQTTPEDTIEASDVITFDETVNGVFIVINAEIKSYASYDTSSQIINSWAIGEEANVTALTSNGYYKIEKNKVEQYIKKTNLVEKNLYDEAWKETNRIDSTCKAEGCITYTNSYTGENKTKILKTKEHDMTVTEKQAATCTEDGFEKSNCSMCGLEFQKPISAPGHLPGELEIIKKAGIFTAGKSELKCVECEELLESNEIKARIPLHDLFIGIAIFAVIVSIRAYSVEKTTDNTF